ncbi:MAG: flavodoxin family protein [Ruminococcus sp.]|nr:flavodoxin family protein [Ruminococcus sp.]
MKKVFIYAASRSNNSSLKIANYLAEKITEYSENPVECSIYTPREINILSCQGCNICFYKGKCSLDAKDGFDKIKDEMIESDMIILISPVYAHNVTGDMKIFIDRISHWLHLMRLAGKLSVPVSVSSTNGNKYVDDYLKKILEWMGTKVAASLSITTDYPAMLQEDFYMNKQLPKICRKLAVALDVGGFDSTPQQEAFFSSLKGTYKQNQGVDNAEQRYWLESGMLKFDSFESYVRHSILEAV